MKVGEAENNLPTISPWLSRWFRRYARRFLRKHFHAVRVLETHGLTSAFPELPVVVFLNHPSWWDPLACLFLADLHFGARESFGPMDAEAFRRYPLLSKVGFFPVERTGARGAAEFLQLATSILRTPRRMLWLTPQGKFADVRARPVQLERGLAHLAARVAPAVFLPLAVEYSFWEERTPEILLAWGTPLFTANHQDSCGADDWSSALERTLQDAQDALAAAAQRRQPNEWAVVLRGRSGTTAVYDWWRSSRARISGRSFTSAHGRL